MIAFPLAGDSQPENIELPTLFQPIKFPNDILLIWDLDSSQDKVHEEDYECLIRSRVRHQCPNTECKSLEYWEKAIRFWNGALIFDRIGKYKVAGTNLRKAVDLYRMAIVNGNCPGGEMDEETLKIMDFLRVKEKDAEIEACCERGGTLLGWAAGVVTWPSCNCYSTKAPMSRRVVI
jgi:hypothetical protein